MTVSSPYAVFRADDAAWMPRRPVITARVSVQQIQAAPSQRTEARRRRKGSLQPWKPMVQGELFHFA